MTDWMTDNPNFSKWGYYKTRLKTFHSKTCNKCLKCGHYALLFATHIFYMEDLTWVLIYYWIYQRSWVKDKMWGLLNILSLFPPTSLINSIIESMAVRFYLALRFYHKVCNFVMDFCLFDLITYVLVNNLSAVLGQVFLCWTGTKQG